MASSSRKRSRVPRRGSSSQPPNPEENVAHLFTSSDQIIRYQNDFKDRSLIAPRYIDSNLFESQLSEVYAYLGRWNLLKFLTIREKVYPELVKTFYTNLQLQGSTLVSEVKGVSIFIDPLLLSMITGLEFSGTTLAGNGTAPSEWEMDYNSENALRFLVGPPTGRPGERNLAGKCSVTHRILHYILARALVPRSGNYAQLTLDDVLILWGITHERTINWGLLIVHHMISMQRKKNGMLPYSMLITCFLRHFEVPLEDETTLPETIHWKIDSSTLSQMGYVERDGTWVPSTQAQHEDTPEPQPDMDASSQALMEFMRVQFERIHTRFDSLDTRVGRLEDIVSHRYPPADDDDHDTPTA